MTMFEAQPLLGNSAWWSDSAEMDAMVRALALESQETMHGPVARPSLKDTPAGQANERGMQRRGEGDLPGALAEFDLALRLNAGLGVARNNRGVTRHELGDLEGALADFDEALRGDPDYADAYGNRAAVRSEQGDAEGATADCRRALELAPDSVSLHARRGAVLHQQKNWLGARAEYDRALRLDAGLHWVYLLRGNAQFHLGNWQALCADYRSGFALAASRCAGLLARQLRSSLKADTTATLITAEEHLKQDPDNPIAHAYRGLLLLLLRRDAEAEEDFARCRGLLADAAPFLELSVREVWKRLSSQ
jgi:tetratricopeptide (TPR) repeat protein